MSTPSSFKFTTAEEVRSAIQKKTFDSKTQVLEQILERIDEEIVIAKENPDIFNKIEIDIQKIVKEIENKNPYSFSEIYMSYFNKVIIEKLEQAGFVVIQNYSNWSITLYLNQKRDHKHLHGPYDDNYKNHYKNLVYRY